MKTKVYIVAPVNWEYNDEYYYRTDGIGTPQGGYFSEKEANEECLKRNMKEARAHGNIFDFVGEGGLAEHVDEEELEKITKIIKKYKGDIDDYYANVDTKKLTDAELKQILDMTGIEFYTVEDVELQGSWHEAVTEA